MPIATTSSGLTIKEALLNQYQAILAVGTGCLCLLAGEAWPLLVFAGLECVVLPAVVGNARLARALAMRGRTERPAAEDAREPVSKEGLEPARRRQLESLESLASTIERSYARLSSDSRILLGEQRRKLGTLLRSARENLLTLQSFDDLDRDTAATGPSVVELRRKLADPALSERLRVSYQEALDVEERLQASLARSREIRESLDTQLRTLETALRILARESASLSAPTELSARLDDLVAGAETAGRTVEELESLSRQARRTATTR